MQKKLIALAVAAVAAPAFAQSNVTISGVADAYYGRLSADGYDAYNAINSGGLSGSRIKFSGAEDLGNGMKAIFEMEQAFDLTDNNVPSATSTTTVSILDEDGDGVADVDAAGNSLHQATTTTTNGAGKITSTRQAYVGLAGAFGAVVFGRLQTPGYYVGKFDALASAAISPQARLAAGKMIGGGVGSTIAPSDNGRLNSAVAYLSPNFGGFSAVVAASASNYGSEQVIAKTAATDDEGAYAVGLNYAAGPVAVGFVHHNIQNYAGVGEYDAVENMIGASFNAGFLTVLGSYQDAKLKDHLAGDGLTTDKNKLYQIGVVVPVGAGNIHAAYGKLNMKADDMDASSYTVAYTHGLSKRTTAYAGYNVTDNDGTVAAGQNLGITTVEKGGKSKGLVFGVRHTF